jgi:hypothetical protein
MDKKILKMENCYEPTSAEKRQFADDLKRIINKPVQENDPFAAFRQLIAMDLSSEERRCEVDSHSFDRDGRKPR